MRVLLVLALIAGCAELGVVGDGTTVSWGRPHDGVILDPVRLPDSGDGYLTREKWRSRGNRYGTDEMIDLLTGVARRAVVKNGVRVVIADIAAKGGGPAYAWHRSHQTGRDVDLLFFYKDAAGKPIEADTMRYFDNDLKAKDTSGYTIDVPRTWQFVRELLTAREATVQWIFLYQALVDRLIAHAVATNEPEAIIAKARIALRQPQKSAPHDDHMHVRVFCPVNDRAYGCVDNGPFDLLTMAEAEPPVPPTPMLRRLPVMVHRR
jgi:penicillin-insensitive murein DD-endopeptidase